MSASAFAAGAAGERGTGRASRDRGAIASTSTASPRALGPKLSFSVAPGPQASSAASITLPQACVTAIPRSSISSRLKPNWPPSEVATRFASPMNSPWAGILSSASWGLAASGIRLRLLCHVLPLLPAVACRALQLLTAAVRRSDAVIYGAPYRVFGITCDAASRTGQLDRSCAQGLHLLTPWAGREGRPGHEAKREADEKTPAEAAAALTVVSHLSISFGGSGGMAPSRPVKLRNRLLAPALTPWRVDWVGPSERPTTSVS